MIRNEGARQRTKELELAISCFSHETAPVSFALYLETTFSRLPAESSGCPAEISCRLRERKARRGGRPFRTGRSKAAARVTHAPINGPAFLSYLATKNTAHWARRAMAQSGARLVDQGPFVSIGTPSRRSSKSAVKRGQVTYPIGEVKRRELGRVPQLRFAAQFAPFLRLCGNQNAISSPSTRSNKTPAP